MNKRIIEKLQKVITVFTENNDLSATDKKELEKALDCFLALTQPPLPKKPVTKSTDKPVYIWSDGACSGNPGPGGWGTIVEINGERFEYSGGSYKTTNNIMELTGALEGIKMTPVGCSIILTSDSQYLVKGMTQWIKGWIKKGWKKADGKAVLNQELWMELEKEASKRSIQWNWIKGHAGHFENERCDELAREAIIR